VLALVLALTTSIAATAQSADQQTGASRVALASVTDPRNRPLVDVGPDDFVIQEAGTSRDILSVRPADYPIVILLDTGSDARADFPAHAEGGRALSSIASDSDRLRSARSATCRSWSRRSRTNGRR
jgi:hypothetical protein